MKSDGTHIMVCSMPDITAGNCQHMTLLLSTEAYGHSIIFQCEWQYGEMAEISWREIDYMAWQGWTSKVCNNRHCRLGLLLLDMSLFTCETDCEAYSSGIMKEHTHTTHSHSTHTRLDWQCYNITVDSVPVSAWGGRCGLACRIPSIQHSARRVLWSSPTNRLHFPLAKRPIHNNYILIKKEQPN